jgi:hypothetical protein
MDPEMLLTSLGFAGGAQTDDTLGRVPDRFLLSQAVKPGVDQYQLMVNHPELQHLIPVMGTSQLRQGTSHMMPETSLVNAAEDHVDGGAGNHEKRKGQLINLCNKGTNADANLENFDKDIPIRFVNSNENNEEKIPNKSRILELCGIVPERYLITNSKVKTENAGADKDTAAEGNEEELGERKSKEDRASHTTNDTHCSADISQKENIPQYNPVYTKLERKGKVSDETIVVEVEIHDHSAMLDKTLKEHGDTNDRVNSARESDKLTADLGKDKQGIDELNGLVEMGRNTDGEMEGLRSWSSTSSDSFDDPYLDLDVVDKETVV